MSTRPGTRTLTRLVFWTWLLGIASVFITSSCAADDKANAILREAFGKMQAARTMTAKLDFTISVLGTRQQQHSTGTFVAMKPNFLRVELQGPGAPVYISDGKYYYSWVVGAPLYQKDPVAAKPTEFIGRWEGEIDGFFGGAANVEKVTAALHTGIEKVDGVECDIVKGQMKDPMKKDPTRDVIYAIGKTDRLIRRATITMQGPAGTTRQVNRISDIKFNTPKTPADFQFKPPPNAKPAPPRRREVITVLAQADTSLLRETFDRVYREAVNGG